MTDRSPTGNPARASGLPGGSGSPGGHGPGPAPELLGRTLTRLDTVADGAGLDRAAARLEGMALAAAVAEAGKQAFVDWAEQVGEEPSAERFMAVAQHGRRWRGAPTALLHELAQSDPAQAAAYAAVLADICTAACTLGQPNARVAGNAQAAAAAQLAAVDRPDAVPPTPDRLIPRVPDASVWDSPVAQPPLGGDALDESSRTLRRVGASTGRAHDFARQAPQVLRTVLEQLGGSVRRQQSGLDRPGPGSSLDLDPTLPLGPGAFAGLPGSLDRTPGGAPDGPALSPPAAHPSTSDVAEPERGGPEHPVQTADTAAAQAAAPEPEPKSLDELLAELDALTGLTRVKEEIHKQAAVLRIKGLRSEQGLASPTVTRHLVFVGNPGTGKTTVARLVAGIYRALGLLSKGQLVEVDRSELVAGYLGQTALKTADVVKSAEGGVLFVDEAYALSGDQYGTEAITTLVKEMEDKRDDLVVIVAGYPVPMAIFIAENPGLASRFRTTIGFEDYTDNELVDIFAGMVSIADYDGPHETIARFEEIVADQVRDSTLGNGRFVRNCLEAAIGAHAWRLRDVPTPSLKELRTLVPEDLDFLEPDDDDDRLPDLAALQPPPGQPLEAPDAFVDANDPVDFGVLGGRPASPVAPGEAEDDRQERT